MEEAFAAYEDVLSQTGAAGSFSHGNLPTMADACLVPQVYMAHRFGVPTGAYPGISRVVDACMGLAAFQRAAPG
jgi:glutathione S-transferase